MTRTALVLALLAAMAAGAAAGFHFGSRQASPPGRAPASTAPDNAASRPAATRPAAVPGAAPGDLEDLAGARQRALDDPAHLADLLRQYATERQPDRKGALLAILAGVANAEVLRAARALVRSDDPGQREDGLRLLAAFPLSEPAARQEIVEQLSTQTDPAALVQVVGMLVPSLMPREDAEPLLGQLQALARHPDAGVRAGSVLQLAQWNAVDAEPVLHDAMLDAAPEVRRAAIAGVVASHVRSGRLKDALLDIATSPGAEPGERGAAVFALQSFALGREDFALYEQAAAQVAHDDPH